MLADGLLVNEIFRLLRREGDGRTPLADGFRFWKEFLTSSQLSTVFQYLLYIGAKCRKIIILHLSSWSIFLGNWLCGSFLQIVIADHCFCKICKLLFNSISSGKISFIVCKFWILCFQTNFFANFIFVPDYFFATSHSRIVLVVRVVQVVRSPQYRKCGPALELHDNRIFPSFQRGWQWRLN